MTARPLITNEALPIGTRLGGCTIDGVLAEDDFGFVYRITDSLLLGKVAIKEFFPSAFCQRMGHDMQPRSDADAARVSAGWHAFVEEGRLLNRLQHPSLVRVLDSFEAHGTVYQVMPLVQGPSLARWREAQASAPDAGWLRELLLGLLDPLEALHGQGLLHGDLHPGKVLLPEGAPPMLLGFGTVRRALGLPADASYAPIEQLAVGSHLPRGAWTDLYALGAVTWFAACGRAPVRSSERRVGAPFDPGSTLAAALAPAEVSPRDRAQLAAAVARAMAVLPADRLQSAAELRAVFTASGPPPAMAPAVPEPEPEHDDVPEFAPTEPVHDEEYLMHAGAPAMSEATVFLVGPGHDERVEPEMREAQVPPAPTMSAPPAAPAAHTASTAPAAPAAPVAPEPPATHATRRARAMHETLTRVPGFSAVDEPTMVLPSASYVPRSSGMPAFSATSDDNRPSASSQRRAAAPRRSTATLMGWALALLAGAAVGVAAWRWNDIMTTGHALVLPSSATKTMVPTETAPVVAGAEEPTAAGPRTAPAAAPDAPQPVPPAAVTTSAAVAPPARAGAGPEPSDARPLAGSGTASAAGETVAGEPAGSEGAAAAAPREEVIDVKPPARRAAAAPRPAARPPASVTAAEAPRAPLSPRAACGTRANFSLHYCMQAQCRKPDYMAHPQCRELARTGEVG